MAEIAHSSPVGRSAIAPAPERPLRIAFLVGRFPSISETFILEQITGLIELGQQVDIFARRPDPSPVVHEQIKKFSLAERVSYGGTPSKVIPRLVKALGLILKWGFRRPGIILRSLNVGRYGADASSFKLL